MNDDSLIESPCDPSRQDYCFSATVVFMAGEAFLYMILFLFLTTKLLEVCLESRKGNIFSLLILLFFMLNCFF